MGLAETKKRYRAKPETKAKEKAYDKEWRDKNRDKVNEKRRERYAANKNGARDKIKISNRKDMAKNREEVTARYLKRFHKIQEPQILQAISINLKIKRLCAK